jgi:hypothetical protein
MTKPRPAAEFINLLLRSEEFLSACKEELGDKSDELLQQAHGGDGAELAEWFDEWRSYSPDEVRIIEGAAPDDDVFHICINRSGPLYWIQANEFDDICYFSSEDDAAEYAEQEFGSFIETLCEREENKSD